MTLTDRVLKPWFALKPADRRALSIVTVFLLIVFGYVYVIEPVLDRYDSVKSELTSLSDQQRRFKRQVRMLPRRELKLAEHRSRLAELKRRFDLQAESSEAAVSVAINEISYYARLAEIEVSSMRPLEALPGADYIDVALEVEASASYAAMHEFFYYIETSPSLLAITDLDLSLQKSTETVQARFKLSNIVRAGDQIDGPTPALLARENRLRLIIPKWVGYAPLVVARHNGYLDAEDRRVELLIADDNVTIERLLLSAEADGVGTSLPGLLDYWVKGIPLKVVLPLASSSGTEGIVVRTESPVQSVQDLRGQSVAVAPQGLLQFVLYKALSSAGLSMQDVSVAALSPSQVARRIASGTVGIGLVREPYLTELVENNQARVIYRSAELQGLLVDLLVVTPDVIRDKAQTLQFLVDGLVKARRFILEQPDEALQIIAEWSGQDTESTAADLARLKLLGETETEEFITGDKLPEQVALFENYRESVELPLPLVTYEDLVDLSFFDKTIGVYAMTGDEVKLEDAPATASELQKSRSVAEPDIQLNDIDNNDKSESGSLKVTPVAAPALVDSDG